MKKTRLFLAALCLTMIGSSCANEFDKKAEVGSGQEFEASFTESPTETRVVVDSELKKVSWELTDELGIFDAGYSTAVKAKISSLADEGKKAIFSPVSAVIAPTFAYQPFTAEASADETSVTVKVAASQSGKFGDALVAAAKNDDGKFAFKMMSAIFQFTVSDPAVKSVVIKGTGIAGDIKATVDGAGSMTVAPVGTASDEITVTVEPDQVCYVAVVPKEYSGLTFTYKDKDGVELGSTKCKDKMTAHSGDLLTWGDFAKLQKAYLPDGPDFNKALETVAGGSDNIKSIAFMTGYKPVGTVINEGTEGAPIGIDFSSGTVFVCTPANGFVSNADMSNMFSLMNKLESISGFDKIETSDVTDMSFLFECCNSLKSIDLSNFNTSNVTNMHSMFCECRSITSLDLSNFNTSKVENLSSMFSDMDALTSLDLSNFNTSNVTNMGYGIESCPKLSILTLGDDFKIPGSNKEDLFKYLGTDNSKPYTTFYCNSDQWKEICELIGATDIVNYKWGNAPAAAKLPVGTDFNAALKTAAGGSLTNIKTIIFETLSSKTGTVINSGLGDTPVYVSYSSGAITVSTQADSFKANSNCAKMFYDMTSLTSINNFASVNTSAVTTMNFMFYGCSSLTSIDLSKFNTSNVIYFSCFLRDCSSLTSVDLSSFNTSKAEDMRSMFYGCSKLKSLDLASFNTSNLTALPFMFRGCTSLTSLNISSFNTAKVTDMQYMFDGCNSLTSITFGSGFTTTNVANMSGMFRDCQALKSLDLSKFNTANVANMHAMFKWCSSLTSLDLSSFNTTNVTEMDSLFINTQKLATLKLGSYFKIPSTTPKSVTINLGLASSTSPNVKTTLGCPYDQWMDFVKMRKNDGFNVLNYRWKNVPTAAPLPVGTALNNKFKEAAGGNLANIKTITFTAESYDTSGTLINDELDVSPVYLKYSSGNITLYTPSKGFSTTSCASYFDGCSALTTISGFEKVSTVNCTSMQRMFLDCTSLTSVNLSQINTANVTTMFCLFYNCNSLSSIDLSKFNTAKVTTMQSMFYGCSSVTSLDVSTFYTKNVKSMYYMFFGCSKLTSLNLGGFDTSNVTEMGNMFGNCSKLASITLGSNFKFATSTTDIFKNLGSGNSIPKTTFTCTPAQWIEIAKLLPADNQYKWANRVDAYLPSGSNFNTALVNFAGSITAIKKIVFDAEWSYSHYKGTLINPGTSGAPIYAYNESGTIYLYTMGPKIIADINCSGMFKGMTELTEITGLNSYVSTAMTTNMSSMFEDCKKLTSLKLVSSDGTTKFVTSNVTNMQRMFYNCYALPSLDLSKFNTANVMYMNSMFYSCESLTTLDLSYFNTAKVTNMNFMFAYCSKITSINVTNWNTAAVIGMNNMFRACKKLTSLNLKSFNTANVTNFSSMFDSCYLLKTITFGRSFKIGSTANTTDMFKSLGINNTTPYTTFIVQKDNTDLMKAISTIVGSANWGNYSGATIS